ncbi:hypothetical protein [Eudoraea adriatica]|uniref:hypothetical protein n=1 Tax=Eudoraea adriatica TaxID=446681 RepID=UPI00039B6C00|nr:hypothetical protein [Eudoraea adriatica]
MKHNFLILFVFLVSFSYGQQKRTSNVTYDLVVLNGRVMDPDKNFVVIMKDGKIYKNTLK